MYCPNCGAEAADGAKFCGSCGEALPWAEATQGAPAEQAAPEPEPVYEQPAAAPKPEPIYQQPIAASAPVYEQPAPGPVVVQGPSRATGSSVPFPRSSSDNTLLMIAFILNIILTVCLAVCVLPLAWMIPMTVVSYGVWKGTRRNTVAFGVCTLLFVSIISGILMLVAEKDE